MREYDIYLKNRLTKAQLIIGSIPYRDGVSATDRILLETMLAYFMLQKFVAVSAKSELVADVGELLATVREIIGNETEISIDAEFFAKIRSELENNDIAILDNDLLMACQSFFTATDTVQIRLSDAACGIKASLGSGYGTIGITVDDLGETKVSVERAASSIGITESELASNKHSFENAGTEIAIGSDEFDIFYRYTIALDVAMSVAASLADIETHYSLGDGSNTIEVAAIENGNFAVKNLTVVQAVTMVSDLTESVRKFFASEIDAAVSAKVTAGLKRYRKLYEIDPSPLSDIDNKPLSELDYYTIA